MKPEPKYSWYEQGIILSAIAELLAHSTDYKETQKIVEIKNKLQELQILTVK